MRSASCSYRVVGVIRSDDALRQTFPTAFADANSPTGTGLFLVRQPIWMRDAAGSPDRGNHEVEHPSFSRQVGRDLFQQHDPSRMRNGHFSRRRALPAPPCAAPLRRSRHRATGVSTDWFGLLFAAMPMVRCFGGGAVFIHPSPAFLFHLRSRRSTDNLPYRLRWSNRWQPATPTRHFCSANKRHVPPGGWDEAADRTVFLA